MRLVEDLLGTGFLCMRSENAGPKAFRDPSHSSLDEVAPFRKLDPGLVSIPASSMERINYRRNGEISVPCAAIINYPNKEFTVFLDFETISLASCHSPKDAS